MTEAKEIETKRKITRTQKITTKKRNEQANTNITWGEGHIRNQQQQKRTQSKINKINETKKKRRATHKLTTQKQETKHNHNEKNTT